MTGHGRRLLAVAVAALTGEDRRPGPDREQVTGLAIDEAIDVMIAGYLPEADASLVILVNQSNLEGGPADFPFYDIAALLVPERFPGLQTRPWAPRLEHFQCGPNFQR